MRWVEFVPAMLLVGDGVAVPGAGFPVSLIGVTLLILVAFTRRPTRGLGNYWWIPVVLFLLLAWVALVSALSTPTEFASPWPRRVIRIAAILVLALCIATGRLNYSTLLKGLGLGLVANAAAFFLGFAPDFYGGALTGWLWDKNRAGMFYSVGGLLVLLVLRNHTLRLVAIATTAGMLWLTGSRTSMSAFGFGLLWLWLLSARPAVIRWLGAGGVAAAALYLERNFAQAGVFESRWGSDLLRDRIDAAAVVKAAQTPPQGMGLGEAYVVIDGHSWYFHDAYATLLVEGGWLYAVGVVALTAWVGLRPFQSHGSNREGRVIQAATVAVLICAWKLGEVFLTIPWALVFGISLNQLLDPISRADSPIESTTQATKPDE